MADKKKAGTEAPLSVADTLNEIEKLLKRIGVMYNQYFAGGIKQAPTQLRLQVERMLRDLTKETIRSSAHRHKFNSLSATYASMQALWSAKLREREIGEKPGQRNSRLVSFSEKKVRTFLKRDEPAAGKTADQPAQETPQPVAAAPAPAASTGSSPLHKLFDRLVEVQKANGQTVPFQSAEHLGKFLAMQKAKLEQQTGMTGIQLKVAIEDGKLKVKAQMPEPASG